MRPGIAPESAKGLDVMSTKPINSNQQALIDAFDKLDSSMKQLLQVAAVSDLMARTNLIELSNKGGIRNANGRMLVYREDRAAIDAVFFLLFDQLHNFFRHTAVERFAKNVVAQQSGAVKGTASKNRRYCGLRHGHERQVAICTGAGADCRRTV
jgi:hypothetical protein